MMGKKGSNPPPPRQPANCQRVFNEGANVNPAPPTNFRPSPPPAPPPPAKKDN